MFEDSLGTQMQNRNIHITLSLLYLRIKIKRDKYHATENKNILFKIHYENYEKRIGPLKKYIVNTRKDFVITSKNHVIIGVIYFVITRKISLI